MEIDNFIKIYDEVIHFERVASLVRHAADKLKFKDSVFGKKKSIKKILENKAYI